MDLLFSLFCFCFIIILMIVITCKDDFKNISEYKKVVWLCIFAICIFAFGIWSIVKIPFQIKRQRIEISDSIEIGNISIRFQQPMKVLIFTYEKPYSIKNDTHEYFVYPMEKE